MGRLQSRLGKTQQTSRYVHDPLVRMESLECEPLETDHDDIVHTTAANSRADYRAVLAKRNRRADMFMTR